VPTMFMWDADTLESLPVDGSRATFARFRHCYVDPSNGKTRFLISNTRDGPFEIRDADTLEVIGSVPPLGEWLPPFYSSIPQTIRCLALHLPRLAKGPVHCSLSTH
jgi:hypothetical protein